jgi:aminoglycoside phosphotransferase (APT) family kinase protein
MIGGMGNTWDAEVEVTAERVRELLRDQFPGLVIGGLQLYGEGWDNVAFLVNGSWVFRFPKREAARLAMEHEILCLQALGDDLPLRVPRIEFVGRPQGEYPFPFSGYAELPGRTACSVDWTLPDRMAVAPRLGAFLACLHDETQPLARNAGLPGDLIRRTDLPFRLQGLQERLALLEPSQELPDGERMIEWAGDLARSEPWGGTARVVHGDLYARHLLVDSDQRLTGVIDWGDAHLGDPALDLSVLFGFLPAQARPGFLQAYGEIDMETLRRARFRAMVVGAALVQYGESIGDLPIARAGRFALSHSVEG